MCKKEEKNNRGKRYCPNSSEGEFNSFGISRKYVCIGMSIIQLIQCTILLSTYPFRYEIISCTRSSNGIDSVIIQYGKQFTIAIYLKKAFQYNRPSIKSLSTPFRQRFLEHSGYCVCSLQYCYKYYLSCCCNKGIILKNPLKIALK